MITATVIYLYNPEIDIERQFIIRFEYCADNSHKLEKFHSYINNNGWEICGLVGYQQPTASQSIHYFYTGEVI